jgi:predicted nucleic acid-binding protein
MRDFVQQLTYSDWHIENLTGADLERAQELLSVYKDAELDFADATIIAMAERLDVDTILTLDRRDFRMVRPLHAGYFNLLP